MKLKQASAVLQIEPKELQNLVQFGVVKPKRFEGTYFFDMNTLMVANVAFCLKESLGTRTSVLSKLMDVFLASEKEFKADNPKYIVFKCRLSAEEDPIKVGVPFRALGEQLQEQMIRADLYRDLPRGRKRRGWKKEFLESLTEAAKEIGEVSDQESCRQFAPIVRKDERRKLPLPRKAKKQKSRGVVDTNVLVAGISGFRKPYVWGKNPSADVLYKWAAKGNLVWLVTEDILDEYKEVSKAA